MEVHPMEHFDVAKLWEEMGGVARGVAVLLGLMSAYSISIMIERWVTYRQARRQSRRFTPAVVVCLREGNIDEAIALGEQNSRSHVARVLVAGLHMLKPHASKNEIPEKSLEAARRALERATAAGIADLKRGLGGLATIAAASPFVGLFGTTIGIINAFQGLSGGASVGITAVAGGIAEALVTTAFGLFVAVPALGAFNALSSQIEIFTVEMDNSASELVDYFVERMSSRPAA
jgi:biopolymer transport protein ExbB/TolQ